jgi:hypothetical protein
MQEYGRTGDLTTTPETLQNRIGEMAEDLASVVVDEIKQQQDREPLEERIGEITEDLASTISNEVPKAQLPTDRIGAVVEDLADIIVDVAQQQVQIQHPEVTTTTRATTTASTKTSKRSAKKQKNYWTVDRCIPM